MPKWQRRNAMTQQCQNDAMTQWQRNGKNDASKMQWRNDNAMIQRHRNDAMKKWRNDAMTTQSQGLHTAQWQRNDSEYNTITTKKMKVNTNTTSSLNVWNEWFNFRWPISREALYVIFTGQFGRNTSRCRVGVLPLRATSMRTNY